MAKTRTKAEERKPGAMTEIKEYAKVIILALALALSIRGFIAEPFKIPSSSMVPTLLIGDYLFVSKFAYGLRVPFTRYFLTNKDPQRGDIVVFQKEFNGSNTNFIKRITAVPGDKVAYFNKRLYVNGKPFSLKLEGTYTYFDSNEDERIVKHYTETLGEVDHAVLLDDQRPAMDVPPMVVPENMYVLMGDNRDNSLDGRAWSYPQWFFLPREDILGRAEFIFWSWDHNFMPRFSRLFGSLRKQEIISQ